MKTNFSITLIAIFIGLSSAFASVKSDIEKANKSGKSVFLVVTDADISETENAITTANQAQQLSPKSIVIKMNRSEAENSELVSKYRLSGAPLPLILVIASNEILSGGYVLNQATPEKLVALVPSPKKADVLKAINEKKSVFVVFSTRSMKENKTVMSTCKTACSEMRGNAEVINIDLDDKNEAGFISELKVDKTSTEPQTFVINSQGQVAGSLSGIVDSNTLIATATKKQSTGCCAPGSGKSCAPAK